MTSTMVEQVSDKSTEKSTGDMGHDRREPQVDAEHEATMQK